MPTYQYSCTECGTALEAQQSFSDEALTVCPECSGRLRKVFSAVGVVFKGSGFYRTDSRSTPKEGSGATTSNGTSGSDTKSESTKSSGDSGSSSSSDSSGTSSSSSTTKAGSAA